MAYETNSATDIDDLFLRWRNFLAANGWTVNKEITAITNGQWFSVQKGSDLFFHFRTLKIAGSTVVWDSLGYYIQCYMSTGFDGAQSFNTQPGTNTTSTGKDVSPHCSNIPQSGGITAYHFFANGDDATMVVEVAPGKFVMLMVGRLQLVGGATDGQYAQGTSFEQGAAAGAINQNDGHALPFDYRWPLYGGGICFNLFRINGAYYNNWDANAGTGLLGFAGVRLGLERLTAFNAAMLRSAPSRINNANILMPLWVFRQASVAGYFHPIGYPADVRSLNMANLAGGDTISVGGVNWMVFPVWSKPASGDCAGYAIRKVV